MGFMSILYSEESRRAELTSLLHELQRPEVLAQARQFDALLQAHLAGKLTVTPDVEPYRLNQTDQRILRLLERCDQRLTTGRIAERLEYSPGTIGENLSRLRRDGLLDNEGGGPGRGYGITPKGRLTLRPPDDPA